MSGEEQFESEEMQSQMDSELLIRVFRDQLMACLKESASGRRGLFSNIEHLVSDEGEIHPWPEAARLRELAFALQAMLAQSGKFESRLARAFLNEIGEGH
jgi:hypothetical protein